MLIVSPHVVCHQAQMPRGAEQEVMMTVNPADPSAQKSYGTVPNEDGPTTAEQGETSFMAPNPTETKVRLGQREREATAMLGQTKNRVTLHRVQGLPMQVFWLMSMRQEVETSHTVFQLLCM